MKKADRPPSYGDGFAFRGAGLETPCLVVEPYVTSGGLRSLRGWCRVHERWLVHGYPYGPRAAHCRCFQSYILMPISACLHMPAFGAYFKAQPPDTVYRLDPEDFIYGYFENASLNQSELEGLAEMARRLKDGEK